MLRHLRIRNIAVIDNLEVEFGEGLNVITGETGSGKSIIIDAVGLLAGARASAELIRTGASRAEAEGEFRPDPDNPVWELIREQGIETGEDDPAVIVRRELSAAGSGRAWVNGVLVTAGFLRRAGECLVEIHGQHDTRLLLQPRYHLELLDQCHGDVALLAEVRELSADIARRQADLRRLDQAGQERLQRLDLLEFQLKELEDAALQPGEEIRLQDERTLVANAEKLFQLSVEGYSQLYEEKDAVLNRLSRLQQRMCELARIDPRLEKPAEQLGSSLYQLEDVAFFLRDYSGSIEYSNDRLDRIEERLALIGRLMRKYGPSTGAMLEYLAQIRREREDLQSIDETRQETVRQLEQAQTEYRGLAAQLRQVRKSAAERVELRMQEHLEELAMAGTRFQVYMQPVDGTGSFGPAGEDQVEFMVSPNVGEELRALQKIVSGGELSRLALALKLVLSSDPGAALIFDEVDAGVGGGTAEMTGRKLKGVSTRNQTFCITHVPQIAALADHHFGVEKTVENGRTCTRIRELVKEERIAEIARMLGGVVITEVTRQHARQMLKRT